MGRSILAGIKNLGENKEGINNRNNRDNRYHRLIYCYGYISVAIFTSEWFLDYGNGSVTKCPSSPNNY